MAKRYCVRIKAPTGATVQESVVLSNSPRDAVDAFCTQMQRSVMSVVKYGSWQELQNAFHAQGGSCWPCEVFQLYGDRKNFYLMYI